MSKNVYYWYQLFYDEGLYHIETSPSIYRANQWTGFYMIGVSVMKELNASWKAKLGDDPSDFMHIYEYQFESRLCTLFFVL